MNDETKEKILKKLFNMEYIGFRGDYQNKRMFSSIDIDNVINESYEQGKSEVLKKLYSICREGHFWIYEEVLKSLTSQPQTPQSTGHDGLNDTKGVYNVESPSYKPATLGESLRAKYCDECKTKQGEEDVA